MQNNFASKKDLEDLKTDFSQELDKELSELTMKDYMRYEFNKLKKEMREREKRLNEKYLKILETLDRIVRLLKND